MLKLFKRFQRKEAVMILVCLIFIIGQVWLDLTMPDYMSEITTLVQTEGSAMSEIWLAGGNMLLCALGSLVLSIMTGFLAAQVAASFSKRLRAGIFQQVEGFSMEEINRFSTASLITRTTNDVTQIQMLVAMGLQVLLKAPIMAVWAIGKIQSKSWQWTAATFAAVAFMLVLIIIAVAFAMPRFKRIQTLTDNLNRVTRENLTGLRVVRAYNAEGYQEGKFQEANQALTSNNLAANRVMAIMFPGMNLVMNGLTLAIYWIGAYLIGAIPLTGAPAVAQRVGVFSDMVVFSSYAMQVVAAFMMLVMIYIIWPRVSVSGKRVLEVLETKPTITDGTRQTGLPGREGEVEFRDVSFRYPDAAENVLEHVSFRAKKGQTVAFIGATGSGKSSLINLVPRFYDATQGQVLVDGVDVREYTLEALHQKLGYVPQRAVMFSGTIASNVTYGAGNTTEEQVKQAVQIAQAADFVESAGYHGPVAQSGANLSGGQKQRLAIARAVCRKPEIYMFDDSFSALDYRTDRALRQALKRETAGVTSLIVAQRIGTIRDADLILVLDDGKVVGQGTHQELLKSCEVYRQIALSQLSKEELEHA
ncbi:MAG: ABC transporter ATP-binding protein [Oscillospiraceae bacterium]|jgi:ATP-binding cassette subfamily B multidrug efflux pump|nr:ABC transporter ATP-binding protein [Bacillota bacterium]